MATDVLIIGAGPCGLAVAARLSESTPSALFTDDEHARYWKRFQRKETLQREAVRKRKQSSGSGSTDSGYGSDADTTEPPSRPSITVLNSTSDQWLGAWKSRFEVLNIKHLRSPLFFHPDPRDKDGLLAYAYEQGRAQELLEIHNVAGKEYSKHARKQQRSRQPRVERHLRVDGRDRIDYYTPSTALFEDYCRSLVDRYQLQGMVQKAAVSDITFGDVGCSSNGRMFTVDTDQGTYLARIVVIATGPSMRPSIPPDHNLRLTDISRKHTSHVFLPNGLSLPSSTLHKISIKRSTQIAIVGGGLTSAQLAVSLLSSGVTHVHLLMRGRYKLKHFDVDLEWVSKVRNQRMAEFWSAETDLERAEMLRDAKNGGSIPPAFDRTLNPWMKAGRLSIHTHTSITDGQFDETKRTWTLQTSSALELHNIEHVFFATGVKPDFSKIPFLQDLQVEHPLDTIAGLPVINEDLMYNDEVPMLFTGALGSLRLGPGAANLAGARQGAERVAWKIEELLKKSKVKASKTSLGSPVKATSRPSAMTAQRSEFSGGFVNQFQALQLTEDVQ